MINLIRKFYWELTVLEAVLTSARPCSHLPPLKWPQTTTTRKTLLKISEQTKAQGHNLNSHSNYHRAPSLWVLAGQMPALHLHVCKMNHGLQRRWVSKLCILLRMSCNLSLNCHKWNEKKTTWFPWSPVCLCSYDGTNIMCSIPFRTDECYIQQLGLVSPQTAQ